MISISNQGANDSKIMVMKTKSIELFLQHKAPPDLAKLYNPNMEVQVNVSQDEGERIQGEYKGRTWSAWTDGNQTWKNFRIPFKANTTPEYNDTEIKFDLGEHAEAIGLTGWDWKNKESLWVGYDFDSIVGHSDSHDAKLSDSELAEVQRAACDIPWVTVRRSTSGNGLHLYVFLDQVETQNHNEHAAVARAILSKMSATVGFDFDSKVDNCGAVLWVWHRKYEKSSGRGFQLIKRGDILTDIPINWRDHIKVTSGRRHRNVPNFIDEKEIDWFEEMAGQHPKVPLDEQHKSLINYLEENKALWWWDKDHHMLVCHTYDLKQAHQQLNMRGIFDTIAEGSERGDDQNAFCHPMRRGAWVVRRHTPGVQEASTWDQDSSGWTRCYLNREPDLKTAARSEGGAEDENGSFMFQEAEVAVKAAQALGVNIDLNVAYARRQATLKQHKDGRLIFEINKSNEDNPAAWRGWVDKKRVWRKVFSVRLNTQYEPDVGNYDDIIRHLVAEAGGDAGWVVKTQDGWKEEPQSHVKLALKALGHSPKESDLIMGQAVLKRWVLVNKPFFPEYPGDRMWNKDAAQLAIAPNPDTDDLNYPTWKMLFDHIAKSIDTEIKEIGMESGEEYLRLWVASMIQQPFEPLPYLFLYGPQSSGKSIFHEALSLIMTHGIVRADSALISGSGFNGELQSAVLCVIEETDLSQNRTQAYNRIKDWVTGQTISIHTKGATPYTAKNSTHWVQCANEIESCPVFPGDTRITMMRVDPPEETIAKRHLLTRLKKEAPDFLSSILNTELPQFNDRLALPALNTRAKTSASKLNQNELEAFIEEQVHIVDGEMILLSEFYDRFREWLDPERRPQWSKRKMGQNLPYPIIKGRWMKDKARHYIGNVSWQNKTSTKLRLVLDGEKLVHGTVD